MPGTSSPLRGGANRRRMHVGVLQQLLQGNSKSTQPPATRRPRALLAGKLDALAAPGGGEVQLLAMADALPASGVDARLWRPWEDTLADVDLLHLFGSLPEHLATVASAKKQGVPVVLSTIAWFDLASRWHETGSLPRRVIACGRYLARRALPGVRDWRRQLYHAVDLLLPNSTAEAEQLMRLFGVPAERIHVVPNGASEHLADGDPQSFIRLAGVRDFVLLAGRIEPRKNQLNFLRAMRGSKLPIVVLGNVVPGQERYLDACRRAADASVRFVDALPHDDPWLAGAYAACRCLALPSWYETPGLAALEAGMSGVPLVLTDRGSTREYFGDLARYVSPGDRDAIRREVVAAYGARRNPELACLVSQRYRWSAAAAATREAYAQVLSS